MNMRIPRPKSAKQRLIVVGTVVAIVVASGLTTAAVLDHGKGSEDDSPLMAAPKRTTTTAEVTTTTTTVPETTTTVPATLPQPAAAPIHPYESVPVVQIGTIEIPKLGMLSPIYEGIWLTVIDHGPGHWPGSALPGQIGNTVFPGHRVTHSHPFLDIDKLVPGDKVVFHMPNGDWGYTVTQTLIVKPKDIWVTDATPTGTMTIIACHPKHSAAQRIVVKGTLDPSTAPPPAA